MPFVDRDVYAHLSVRLLLTGPLRGRAAAAVLAIEGELVRRTVASPEWREAVAEVAAYAAESVYEVVLDLRRLYLLDLAGLAEFEGLATLATASGTRLALAGTRPRIREFLRQACADFGDEYPDVSELDDVAQASAPTTAAA